MPCQSCQLLHGRVLPNDDLVLRIAVGTYQLIEVLGEEEIAHLTAGLERTERSEGEGVPEANASVSCASTTREETVLVGRPCDCFHCCNVISEFHLGTRIIVNAPYE